MALYQVSFEPSGKQGSCRSSRSLLDCARRLSVGLASICGGCGSCHSCKVRVLSGTVSAPTASERKILSPEELEAGWRLACQTYPASHCRLGVPPESMTTPHRTQVEGAEATAALEPAVRAYHVRLKAPSLSDLRPDAERLLEALNEENRLSCSEIDVEILRVLSSKLRSWGWECQAYVRSREVVGVGRRAGHHLGLAVDLGSTKIAGYLVDLSSGKTLAARGLPNPQRSYGADIVSRISHAVKSPLARRRLQQLAVGALNRLALDLCAEVKAKREEIVDAVVVGNTAMHHLLLRLPVEQLARAPFLPAVGAAMDIRARDVGLHIAPGAYVHLPPLIAGFVGSDHVAMLLAAGAAQAGGPVVALDIGTNTEVSLIDGGSITSVSCASGPAFEGWHIKDGMAAASGAIERLRLVGDAVQYQTIDGTAPVGICGSGVLDAMAQLYLAGVLETGGRMKDNHPRVRTCGEQREFVIVSEEERGGRAAITINQRDIRELQLAKAAIRAGIEVLLRERGRSENEIQKIIIAGAFGSYIDVGSAVAIGMLPALPLNRFEQVGNAAGTGARLILVSLSKRAEARAMPPRITYIELSAHANFTETFVRANYLGKEAAAARARKTN
ncbi:MAG: ferredoxin (4Fe-4S iron-sulfur cluster binding protein) [Dehalococcoidia bacterium]|nr:ferredoxin (4Fe-4S iron-sulfur cluster binding protein) [Dehalococcoidia bacterium]